MPKINVYLPDDLAAAVRDAGLSVSPICQQALAEAVRAVRATREATVVMRDDASDPRQHPEVTARITGHMTPRLRQALRQAHRLVPPSRLVGTDHFLVGVLNEHGNLGVLVLESLDVDVLALRNAAQSEAGTAVAADVSEPAPPGLETRGGDQAANRVRRSDEDLLDNLSFAARLTIAAALDCARDLGHDFLGCEHLVAALADDDEGPAGPLLRALGVTGARVRGAIPAALAGARLGLAQGGHGATAALASQVDELSRRLVELEARLDPSAD